MFVGVNSVNLLHEVLCILVCVCVCVSVDFVVYSCVCT